MKSLAQICREDKQMMKNTWRPGVRRPLDPLADERRRNGFRIEGYFDNIAKNRGTSRATQSKRGL